VALQFSFEGGEKGWITIGRRPNFYDKLFFFFVAATVTGFFLAGIRSMLRFNASMMSTTLPPRCGAGGEMVTSLPSLFIEQGEHTDAVLVFVILGMKLFCRELVDQPDP
jgi:hypothetical protein